MKGSASIDHDRLFKELLSTFFLEFLDLFFPEVTSYIEPGSLTFLDKEVFTDVTSGEKHEADLVAQLRFAGQRSFFLVHVEAQASSESAFPIRMFRYFARLYEKHGLPVYPVAVFSFSEPLRPEPDKHVVSFPDFDVLHFRFKTIQLNRFRWRDYLERDNPVAAALMAKMKFTVSERPKVKAECLRLLATLKLDRARVRLISGFVDTYLNLNLEEEKLFEREIGTMGATEKEAIMEIVTSWMEKGLEKGLEQGLEQGLEKGLEEGLEKGRRSESALISRQLRKRLGELPQNLEADVSRLPLSALEDLGEALLDFTSQGDLESWLQARR